MASNITELIIKVGNKSTLSFSHSKAYRVVTYDELVTTSNLLPDCHLLIVEGIFDDEYNNIRDFVTDFLNKDKENKVWIYTDDASDDNINGLVDELGYDIFDTKESLFRNIYEVTGLNISTSITLRKEINSKVETNDAFSEFYSDLTTDEYDIEIPSKDEVVEETQQSTEETQQSIEETQQSTEEVMNPVIEEINTQKDIASIDETKNVAVKVNINKQETDGEKLVSKNNEQSELRENTTTEKVVEHTVKVVDNSVNEELERKLRELQSKVNSLTVENKELHRTIDNNNSEISNLTLANKFITEKYELVIEEYNSIVNSDTLLEEPITLTEYIKLKEEIDNLKDSLEEQREETDKIKSELNDQIDEYKSQIVDLKESLDESEKALESKKEELVFLNTQIDNGNIQSEELEGARKQVNTLKSEIEDLESIISGQTKDINNLRNKIDKSSEQIEKENFGRKSSVEFSNLLIKKLSLMSEEIKTLSFENEQHRENIKNLRSSDRGNNEVIANQTTEILQLRRKIQDVDRQIEAAVETEKYEKSVLSKKLDKLQQEFDFQKEQLELKESQYNKLKAISTLDEDGANILEEDNKTLRSINSALRDQLLSAQEEAEKAKQENKTIQHSKKLLEEQITTLNSSIRSLQSGMSGAGSGDIKLPSINYNGRAQIFGVFGCGSYGVTTTAISLAKRLAMTSKVLYIDMDLVAPKSDAYFNTPPILDKLPGYVKDKQLLYTGLGIFFSQGMNPLIQYKDQSVINIEPIRRGGLDYLSGVYYKLNDFKLISADFNALLNFYGNNYNNIVIDLGRIGSSDLNDKLIQLIYKVSLRCIGVTTADPLNIRLLRMKMQSAAIDAKKMALLINMSDSSKLSDAGEKLTKGFRYGIMPFYTDLYGNKLETFMERRSRDKFDKFITNAVFSN